MNNLSEYINNKLGIDLERYKEIAIIEKMPDLDVFSQQIFTELRIDTSKEYTTELFTKEQKETISIFYGYYRALSMHLKFHSKYREWSHKAVIEAQKLLDILSSTEINDINHISFNFNVEGPKAFKIANIQTLGYIIEAIKPILKKSTQFPKGGKKRSYTKEYCQQLKPFFNYLISETYLGKYDKIDITYWILFLVGFNWTDNKDTLWDYIRQSKITTLQIRYL